MLRFCGVFVLMGLWPRYSAAQAPAPTDSSWERTLACAHELLASAGYRLSAGKAGLSASRPGSLISSDPPVESVDRVAVYRNDEPAGSLGPALNIEFKRPASTPAGHWRIMASSSAVHQTSPSEQQPYATTLTPSADVRAMANELRQRCSAP